MKGSIGAAAGASTSGGASSGGNLHVLPRPAKILRRRPVQVIVSWVDHLLMALFGKGGTATC